jgi:CBS domain-containing protein
MFTFFTEVIKQDVVDRHGRFLGRPFDFTAKFDEPYPTLTSLIVAKGFLHKKYYVIPWGNLHHAGGQFQLKIPLESLTFVKDYKKEAEMTLRKNILDQQVVDTFNRKVVRVNDLHLLQVDSDLRIAHVDVGIRGLMRRLGWERFIDPAVRFVNRHASYLTAEKFISWKYVQPLSVQPLTGIIHLNVDQKQLRSIPPPDLSEMLMELDPYQRAALFKTLDPQSQIDILTELDLKWQKDLIEELDPRTAADLLEKMPADEATDLLGSLPRRDAERFLDAISPKKSREISELLKYESRSAGGLMTKEFITFKETMNVREALDHIRNTEIKKAETIHNGFVTDENSRLIGMVSLRKLLIESPEAKIGDVMLKKPPAIEVGANVKNVAALLSKYNLFAVPVTDSDGILQGIITVDDVLSVIIEEEWGIK